VQYHSRYQDSPDEIFMTGLEFMNRACGFAALFRHKRIPLLRA
jgi:hypothetical protein